MNYFGIDEKLLEIAEKAEEMCKKQFSQIDKNSYENGQKVLKAFIDNRVSESCLKGTTGYGYGDLGRDTIDKVFAQAFGGEDAVVRHTFVNGTHALSTALFGVLRPGDTLLTLTGKPYDTLEEIIGIRGEVGKGSLKDFGVKYSQIDLIDEKVPDYDVISEKAKVAKVAYIQRSRGYSLRPSLPVEVIGKMAETAKKANPDIIVMTGDMISTNSKSFDNFYSLAKEVSKEYITYYIMGNHELRMPKTQQTKILENLKKFGIKILDNKSINIEKNDEYIKLYGFHQPVSTYKNILKGNFDTSFTLKNMEKIFPYIDNTNFNILLSHSPFDFDVLEKWGADLVLSGHVHGGLIRLPFLGGFLSPERSFFPKYDSGEYCIGDSKMIVSRGLGNGTINIRVFNNPEICVITLNSLEV